MCVMKGLANIADTDGDDDLKAYLDEKVSCVDFEISGLTLETELRYICVEVSECHEAKK